MRLCFLARTGPNRCTSKRDNEIAKYWLEPVSLAKNRGYKEAELKKIVKLVERFQQPLVEAWHDYFGA
jgi:hypothetical protein